MPTGVTSSYPLSYPQKQVFLSHPSPGFLQFSQLCLLCLHLGSLLLDSVVSTLLSLRNSCSPHSRYLSTAPQARLSLLWHLTTFLSAILNESLLSFSCCVASLWKNLAWGFHWWTIKDQTYYFRSYFLTASKTDKEFGITLSLRISLKRWSFFWKGQWLCVSLKHKALTSQMFMESSALSMKTLSSNFLHLK